jgi:Transposase IS66 family
LDISRATLDGWVLKVGELLIPMVAAMRRELISGSYIQADETPVDVQTREGRGKNHQAYLWQYSRPGGGVVESCRRLQVPVRNYFSTILPGLADLPIRCLPDLTPGVWVARHS